MTSYNSSSVYRGGGPQSGGGVAIISLPIRTSSPCSRIFMTPSLQMKSFNMSHTARMWHTEPANTKKWNTECMYFRLLKE